MEPNSSQPPNQNETAATPFSPAAAPSHAHAADFPSAPPPQSPPQQQPISQPLSVQLPQPVTPQTPQPPVPSPNELFQGAVVGDMGVVAGANPVFTPDAPAGQPTKRGPKSFLKFLIIALLAMTVLGGASAAAYYGVYVPNQPQNVLKAAAINTVQQKQLAYSGQLTSTSTAAGDSSALKLEFSGKSDADKKAEALTLNITYSGVTVGLEGRLIDDNIYVKVSDLDKVASELATFVPDEAATFTKLSNLVNDKWIVIDSTLLDKSSAKCALDANLTLNDSDIKLLGQLYQQHPFATIDSSSSDTIDGKKVAKYDVSLDNKTGGQFVDGLKDLSVVKALDKCDKSKSLDKSAADQTSKASGTTKLTIWVDKKSKLISQIGYSDNGETKDNVKVAFNYGPISIDKPTNAVPAVQMLSAIQQQLGGSSADFSNLLNSALFSGLSGSVDTNSSSLTD